MPKDKFKQSIDHTLNYIINKNDDFSFSIINTLISFGIKRYVLCSGIRNSSLILSLLNIKEDDKNSDILIKNHFDERSAGFFALGWSKLDFLNKVGSKDEPLNPVAIITTSGTAVAELLPSAIEAFYSGVPIFIITADRPKRFRGSGSPQAIDQVGIFGDYVNLTLDIDKVQDLKGLNAWDPFKSLHLNICFEEEYIKSFTTKLKTAKNYIKDNLELSSKLSCNTIINCVNKFIHNDKGTIIILGELPYSWREIIEKFLFDLKAPVLAESTSGLRESNLLKNQIFLSDKGLKQRINNNEFSKVMRIGGVPSSKFWREVEFIDELEVMSISHLNFSGLARKSTFYYCHDISFLKSLEIDMPKVKTYKDYDFTYNNLNDLEELEGELTYESCLINKLSNCIQNQSLVFLGNSLTIRNWNYFSSISNYHNNCFASRGANGIDGQLCTYFGMIEESSKESFWGIFGDLTFLYDLNSFFFLNDVHNKKIRIVIVNNGGGNIFSYVPPLSDSYDINKEITGNNHAINFEKLANFWGIDYCLWEKDEPIPKKIINDKNGILLIELII